MAASWAGVTSVNSFFPVAGFVAQPVAAQASTALAATASARRAAGKPLLDPCMARVLRERSVAGAGRSPAGGPLLIPRDAAVHLARPGVDTAGEVLEAREPHLAQDLQRAHAPDALLAGEHE